VAAKEVHYAGGSHLAIYEKSFVLDGRTVYLQAAPPDSLARTVTAALKAAFKRGEEEARYQIRKSLGL
jgi:hypothetical protein